MIATPRPPMNAPRPYDPNTPMLVVSDDLAGGPSPDGLAVQAFSAWRAGLMPVGGSAGAPADLALTDQTVLGLCLTDADADALDRSPELARLVQSLRIPVARLGPAPDEAAVLRAALEAAVARRAAAVEEAAADRAALAEVRMEHMRVQEDFALLENWLHDALLPRHKLARSFAPTAETLFLTPGGEPLVQPLPVPARGFVSVDVHLAESPAEPATLRIRLLRPVGPPYDGAVATTAIRPGQSGWVRLSLPRAGTDWDDAELSVEQLSGAPLALSLAPETPFADMACRHGSTRLAAPVALHVYQTLPRLPAPPLHDPRCPVPADGLTRLLRPSDTDPPEMLPFWRRGFSRAVRPYPDAPWADHWADVGCHVVRPSVARPVVARVPGVTATALVQLRAVVQSGSAHTLPMAVATGIVPAQSVASAEAALPHLGDWVHLLPGEWGEAWAEPAAPLDGPADILIAAAMPGQPFNENADALFHGFRLTGRTAAG